MKKYRALVGLNYMPINGKESVRKEVSEDCSDLRPDDRKDLLANKPPSIEEYEEVESSSGTTGQTENKSPATKGGK
jgi:hypothetical protein